MGFRNFPHFVVAIKHETTNRDFYILRATIDMDLVIQRIQVANLDRYSDVFLINDAGIMQTPSRFFGAEMTRCPIVSDDFIRGREVIERIKYEKEPMLLGYAAIDMTPFTLLVLSRRIETASDWISLKNDIIWFLIVSTLLILLATFMSANYSVRRIREADLRRARMFHNIEYTSKMASIGRMAASVAHEINNPLAIINEKAGLVQDLVNLGSDFPQRDKVGGAVASILRSVERCSSVTRRLLGFARRMEPQKQPIDLKNLISEVVGFLGNEANVRNLDITIDAATEIPTIESDRGQLQQVFLNILNNAVAAVEDGGKIDLILRPREAKNVAVTIRDNGHGISPDNLPHIFEPFYSTKGEFGTGLGLSITKDLIERLGGEISVDSRVGEGTAFTVVLPAKAKNVLA